jgi:uncharacterized protein with NRDE domain
MCLVALALDASPLYSLIFCANRDERHARPSAPAAWWQDRPHVLGGRDLVAGGTWLAVDRRGRFAAVTNFRDTLPSTAPRSRGALVADYLGGTRSAAEFAAALAPRAAEYGPFSLLLLDGTELRYVSNRAPAATLERGVHALSNAAYGSDWPKVRSARDGVAALVDTADPTDALFELLARRAPGAAGDERYRTAHFIDGDTYGTRCSTVVLIARDGTAIFAERTFDAAAHVTGEVRETFIVERALRGP